MNSPKYDAGRALELLRAGTRNPNAEFRPRQESAIQHVVKGRGRLLVVEKTGWGKSLVYFIATKLLRESGMGPALLISPLLALMRNQIDAAIRMGVQAETINSNNEENWSEIEAQVIKDQIDILLISPERLANPRFVQEVLGTIGDDVSLLVIDEAHCISVWGHDFRPHYRLIEGMVQELPGNLRLLATTATANKEVMTDLGKVLGPDLQSQRGPLGRPSLFLQTIELAMPAERLAWLLQVLPTISGSGIIYTLTIRDADRIANWLKEQGIPAEAYSGQSKNRPALEQALLMNELKVLVATTALGMGFDKPDLAFVIHYQMPGSVIAYYQQVGRAGRALGAAYGVLLSGDEESKINDFFIRSAFPSPKEVQEVIDALESSEAGLSVTSLCAQINVAEKRIRHALQLLSLENPAPVIKDGSEWRLTVTQLSPDFWERAERLTTQRRHEEQQMQEYVALESGHMDFLIKALDGEPERYTPPSLPPLPQTADREPLDLANQYLRRTGFPLNPRKQWPANGLPSMNVKGAIDPSFRAAEGRFLCYWGDPGWGEDVRKGKHQGQGYSDGLVTEMERVIRKWAPQPRPTWVTCIPSQRHPELVPKFAARVAQKLGLRFIPVIKKISDRPEQKTMENSSQQAQNVDGAFQIDENGVLADPVLLIDDMVDSRWTLTVIAYLLRHAGSGSVHPVVLASTTRRQP